MGSQSPASDSRPTVEKELLLPEEVIREQMANGEELALIRINSVKERNPGTKSHSTVYKATILKSIPERKSGWSWLGLKRNATFWDWGPPTLAKAEYVTTFGDPDKKNWNSIDGVRSTRRVPDGRGEEIFEAHRSLEEQILARTDMLPDSVLRAAAFGEIEIAALRITSAAKVLDSASPASIHTEYRATALHWLAGKERENPAPLLKGDLTLKPYRIYILAFSANIKEPQSTLAVEVFPGNMEKSIRMHREKIRSFGKNTNSGAP